MSAPAISNHWRVPALIFLWLDVAMTFVAATYLLWDNHFSGGIWIDAVNFMLSGLVLAWWTAIFGRVTLGLGVPKSDGTLRALALAYPFLNALRLVIWGVTVLVALDGTFPTANPVGLTAMLTLSGAAIVAANAVNAGLVRLATAPGEHFHASAERLTDWLNLAAALALGGLVINFVPLKGFGALPSATTTLVLGVGSALELISGVLALLAVRQLARLSASPGAEQRTP